MWPIYCNYGYDPKFSNTVSGLQAGLAGLNGILNIFQAKNKGASNAEAVSSGLNTMFSGATNAVLGNIIDKSTFSYMGTTLNSLAPANNPAAATPALTQAAMYSTMPYMTMPYMMPMAYSITSAWASPMMFGAPMMYGMPSFGGFCCCC